ncbi:hypothetical protein COLO4_20058 [Corchorus olitorius]|uniref:Uncharacterized protein n=1 Tax=Corchorus olitorius TaxID=93759 RepID=A0A1R3J1W6_9ROSI|nr:hypothetical protein COLO4_20058 [Corchorus olitorius]
MARLTMCTRNRAKKRAFKARSNGKISAGSRFRRTVPLPKLQKLFLSLPFFFFFLD